MLLQKVVQFQINPGRVETNKFSPSVKDYIYELLSNGFLIIKCKFEQQNTV